MTRLATFHDHGWLRFPADKVQAGWAAHARSAAAIAEHDPHWLRSGGTWYVGVDALPNDAQGRIGHGPPLDGPAMTFISGALNLNLPLHRGQLSICYPGYPKPDAGESAAAFQFRLTRDAAHVDGLHAEGPARRRFLKEPHAFILGVALNPSHAEASPLVVWDGSHRIMGRLFRAIYGGRPPDQWPEIDVTEAYQAARREVFGTCPRIALPA